MKGDPAAAEATDGQGRFHRYGELDSKFVAKRRVDVWLPPGYYDSDRRYPVIYAQDGQNLFDPSTAYIGVDWGIQEAAARLLEEDSEMGAIVVGIWNTPDRIPEYMPQKLFTDGSYRLERFVTRYGGEPISDDYLRFMSEELKPKVDSSFRTNPDPPSTVLLGSSMGGLISLYGFCEYPSVFGKAVCMSTSWTVAGKPVVEYLKDAVPAPRGRRIYFDYGSEAQIGAYEKLQHEVDRVFYKKGYRRDVHFMVQRFPGDPHSEEAWRGRVEVPLRFVLDTPA